MNHNCGYIPFPTFFAGTFQEFIEQSKLKSVKGRNSTILGGPATETQIKTQGLRKVPEWRPWREMFSSQKLTGETQS